MNAPAVPKKPKIYHIVHVDRLSSIIEDGHLWCDAEIRQRSFSGTIIGMSEIKERRLGMKLNRYPDLFVGSCVPFYFCPRSIMLYIIYKRNNPGISYYGGQDWIVHLESDFYKSVNWAEENDLRWVFTTSNAASNFFEDYNDLSSLNKINWNSVGARNWMSCMDDKQAEFLMETKFPWNLVERIGVCNDDAYHRAKKVISAHLHKPMLQVMTDWYY